MFSLTTLITFAVATLVASIIPGPTVAVIVSNSVRRSSKAGILTAFGAELAVVSMIVVIAIGLEAVVSFMGWAFEWIKLVGAGFLIWLGWKLFTAKDLLHTGPESTSKLTNGYVLQGFLVVWSNPKTLLFLGAFMPQFINTNHSTLPQVLVLGSITMAIAAANDFGYAFLASSLRRFLNETRMRIVGRASGVFLMCGGIWLALQKRA